MKLSGRHYHFFTLKITQLLSKIKNKILSQKNIIYLIHYKNDVRRHIWRKNNVENWKNEIAKLN